MAIQWDESIAVGVKLVDEQHQELFRMVNGLVEAVLGNQGKAEVERLLSFLAVYVIEHFGAEERLMAKYRYPDASSHERQHADLVRKVLRLKADFDDLGPTPQLTVEVKQLVAAWLRDHVAGSDKELGRFLMAEGARDAAR